MIVAIVLASTSAEPVIEFRNAPSTSAAVLAYCGEYSPPKNPDDFAGVNTGWVLPDPRLAHIWAWHSTPGVFVEIDYADPLVAKIEEHRDQRLVDNARAEYPAASGLLFSCSVPAQDSWSKLATLDARGLLAFPFTVHTADQTGSYDLTSSADLTGAIGAVSLAVLAERAAAQAAIDSVISAANGDAARAAAAPYLEA